MTEENEMVVVSIKEVLQVAEDNGYGLAICPWNEDVFDLVGNFEIDIKDVEDELEENPDDPWCKACLKILQEENETVFALVKEIE